MNVADLQDDDYDDYDDYGDAENENLVGDYSQPIDGGYSQPEQPSYLPTSYAPAEASPQQSSYAPPEQPYTPPAQSYAPAETSYSPPAGGGSYGGSSSNNGGLNHMSSMGSSLPAASPPSKYGGGDKCPRCSKTVYFAEAKEGPNNIKYHKTCFSCLFCKKVLDSTFAERQGEVYCKICYGKEFGPKGFGFGTSVQSTPDPTPSPESRPTFNPSPPAQKSWNAAGSGSASNSPSAAVGGSGGEPKAASTRFGGGDKCGRCNKTVYFAEAREGPNNVKYHKPCFSCLLCSKSLDSHFAERKGDLYCKPCYGREFGPTGFGFAGVSSPPPAPNNA